MAAEVPGMEHVSLFLEIPRRRTSTSHHAHLLDVQHRKKKAGVGQCMGYWMEPHRKGS
jgi:hypothetical protein